MLSFLRQSPAVKGCSTALGATFSLWIDGVGCFLVSLNDRVSIGRPEFQLPAVGSASAASSSQGESEIAILSDLKRHHATIVRAGEGYFLEAHGPARVAGREISDRTALPDGTLMELGRNVQLRFQQPSPLSLSARLDFVSDHRPAQAVDSCVLLADTCLLGPGDANHIDCPDWPDQVLLIRKGQSLLCRSRRNLLVNGNRLHSDQALLSGDVVSAEELRFRIERRVG